MIRITYTATRAINGHQIGDPITVKFSAAEMTPSRKVTREVQKTLSGYRETILHNALRSWTITAQPMETTTLDALEEFLQAAESGVAFEFEPYYVEPGSPVATPNSAETRLRLAPVVNCTLASEGYDLARLIGNGNGGRDDWYQVTFTVEEVPA